MRFWEGDYIEYSGYSSLPEEGPQARPTELFYFILDSKSHIISVVNSVFERVVMMETFRNIVIAT
jgi:hypothetical protein